MKQEEGKMNFEWKHKIEEAKDLVKKIDDSEQLKTNYSEFAFEKFWKDIVQTIVTKSNSNHEEMVSLVCATCYLINEKWTQDKTILHEDVSPGEGIASCMIERLGLSREDFLSIGRELRFY
ncbi:MAG: hypothetical protein M0R37_14410 [Bacteroidales bacterium]|nr:hypothetical protein [Bacteroidales bacterium]